MKTSFDTAELAEQFDIYELAPFAPVVPLDDLPAGTLAFVAGVVRKLKAAQGTDPSSPWLPFDGDHPTDLLGLAVCYAYQCGLVRVRELVNRADGTRLHLCAAKE